jgi:hypothetical protein
MRASSIFAVRLKCPIIIAFVSFFTLTCKQREFNYQTKSEAGVANCSVGIRLADYVQPTDQNCYVSSKVEWDGLKGFNPNIRLQPWIPCNNVELFSMAANRYESPNGNRKHYYDFDNAVAYLTHRQFPLAKMIQDVFQNPGIPPSESAGHPVFQAPLHKALMQVIGQAKERIFLNVMLFGGAWGVELIRQALLRVEEAKKQGKDFQIIILRDTLNQFNFGPESDEIWKFIVKNSMQGAYSSNLVVLESNISIRRTSALPIGLEWPAEI